MLSKDIERLEREAVQRQDADWQRQLKEAAEAPAPATMHEFAVSEASLDTGRYSAAMGKPTVVGSTSGVQYPQLPSSSPWSGSDPVGQEPPLGFSVNDLEPSMAAPPVVEVGAPAADEAPPLAVQAPPLAADDVETGTGAPPSCTDDTGGFDDAA